MFVSFWNQLELQEKFPNNKNYVVKIPLLEF